MRGHLEHTTARGLGSPYDFGAWALHRRLAGREHLAHLAGTDFNALLSFSTHEGKQSDSSSSSSVRLSEKTCTNSATTLVVDQL